MGQALKGTMLTPGVSKNGRLYTPELIRKAYTRLSERIAAGDCPVTMLTHHAAGDDSKEIVGQVTSVSLNGQNLDYTAVLADTRPAETIGALVTAKTPFLRNVSIRGAWLGEVRKEDGADTADDLEIDGLDFTKNPGVVGATVEAAGKSAAESVDGRVLITETVEAHAVFTEDAPIVEADDAAFRDRIAKMVIAEVRERLGDGIRANESIAHVFSDGLCTTCGEV